MGFNLRKGIGHPYFRVSFGCLIWKVGLINGLNECFFTK